MVAQVNPLELEPGQMVNDWRIVRRLGRGGYAVVYEVEKDGQRFALKMACQTERSVDSKKTDARARREAACLQQLNHRHIIRLWAQGRWPDARSGFFYVVLDLVEGDTLARWVEQTHPTPHEVAVLFLKLFEALEYMHGHTVFHRDLSLRNIMVTREGEPVIIDFGAADFAAAEELTDGPLPPGTPRNRSPEAMRFWHENRLNPAARYTFKPTDDIFALGANLYDVLTDPTPTRGEKRPPLGHEVLQPPSPHKVTQGRVPLELSSYALKLIHPEPEERYATAKDARGALEEFARLQGPEWRHTRVHPVAAQLPPASAAGAPEPARRRAWLRPVFAGLLALALLAVTVAVFVLARPAPPMLPPVPQSSPAAPPPPSSTLAEKPTNRPAQLPSPLPTQQEASPSVTPPDNSTPLPGGVPSSQPLQKASTRSVFSRAQRCALLVASAAWLQAGCAGVQKRPDPAPCPEGAVKAMEQELGWDVKLGHGPLIVLDVTQPWSRESPPGVYKDGPVTGAVLDPFGKAPAGMRLDGHLWTTGKLIYGRYVRAHLPVGGTVPICVQLQVRSDGPGLPKEPGSKPGHAVRERAGTSAVVSEWE
jgi:serine/threonine-protein kinase